MFVAGANGDDNFKTGMELLLKDPALLLLLLLLLFDEVGDDAGAIIGDIIDVNELLLRVLYFIFIPFFVISSPSSLSTSIAFGFFDFFISLLFFGFKCISGSSFVNISSIPSSSIPLYLIGSI